jgi:hypothetical protein
MELNQDFSSLFNSNSPGAGQTPTAAPAATPSAAPNGLTQDFSSMFAPQQQAQTVRPGDAAKIDDVLASEGAIALKPLVSAFYGQESSSGANPQTSVDNAHGGMQITPATFAQYARPGESIDNPQQNMAVGTRILADYAKRFNNDPAKIAVAYFSGPGNVSTNGPTPWKNNTADGNGTTVSQYVQGILGRLGGAQAQAPAAPQAEAPQQPAAPDISQAPKWTSIVTNPAFQKLTPQEQQQTSDAYFQKWVAPNVSPDQIDAARQEWATKSAAALQQAKPSTWSNVKGAVSNALDTFANATNGFSENGAVPPGATLPQPEPAAGVLGNGQNLPAPQGNLPPMPFATPQFQQQVFQQFDAATPDQRQQMMQRPGVAGQLAQYRAAQYANNQNPMSADIGTSLEDRMQRLVDAGVAPDVARAQAQRDAASGAQTMIPGEMKASNFDFDTAKKFTPGNFFFGTPGIRAAAQGVASSAQSLVGVGRFVNDMTGGNGDVAGWLKNASKNINSTSNAIGQSANPFTRNLESAMSGLIQVMPAMLGAAVTDGASALPIAQFGMQTFGQSYDEGRNAGQTPAQASMRSGLLAAVSMLGHAAGIGPKLEAIQKSIAGAATNDIAGSAFKAFTRDLLPTQAMALGNFITDKLPGGIGLSPDAKFTDWLHQAGDMFVQTAMMNGMLGATAIGGSPLARTLRGEVKPTFDESSNTISDKNGNYWNVAPNTPPVPNLGAPGTSANAPHPSQVAADEAVRNIAATHGMDASGLIPEPTPVPQPAAAAAAAPEAPINLKPGQPLIWSNANTDVPVVYHGVAPDRGPDGRLYAQVEHNGTMSFVPFDELRPDDAAPATPETPATPASAAQAGNFDPQQVMEFAKQRYDVLEAKQQEQRSTVMGPTGFEDTVMPAQALTPTEKMEWDALRQFGNDPRALAHFYGLHDAPVAPDAPSAEQVNAAAHEAATSPKNDVAEPTQAQKEAGNYQKGHVEIHGLDVSIENPQGSTRSGTDADGVVWKNTLQDHYGYIKRTVGADHEQVDTFIGQNPASKKVFIVDQNDPNTGKFDEHKVMLGYDSMAEADAAYHRNYETGWTGRSAISELPIGMFKEWLANGDTHAPFARPATPSTRSAGAKPKTEKEARAARAAVPPVPDGMVRMYHGGEPKPDHTGPLWFSSSEKYARDWAAKDGRVARTWYVDVPADHPALASEYPEQHASNGYTTNRELPADLSSQRKPLPDVAPATPPKTEREAQARKLENANGSSTEAQGRAGTGETQEGGTAPRPVAGTQGSADATARTAGSADDSAPATRPDRGTGADRPENAAGAGSGIRPEPDGSGRPANAGDVNHGLAGENAPGAKESLARTLRDFPDIGEKTAHGVSFVKPDWTELPNGFAYRQYVADGTAYQEIRAPRRGDVEPPVIRRGLSPDGKTFGEREATGTLKDVMSGASFADFNDYFARQKPAAEAAKKLPAPKTAGDVSPTLFTARDGGMPYVIDEEALQRSHLNPKPIKTGGAIDADHSNMLTEAWKKEAQASFNAEGKFIGEHRYRVVTGRGIVMFNDLDGAKKYAASFGMRNGKQREMVPTGASGTEAPKPAKPRTEKEAKAQREQHLIGKNTDGEDVYEDARGVRSIVSDGVRQTESVTMRPTRDGVQTSVQHKGRFLTADEAAASQSTGPRTEKAAPQAEAKNDSAYGANNKTFTADAAEKARATLRAKLRQLNAGLDPEMMHAGMMLAGFHIEAGARKFSDFAKAMVGDIGENIRPYLRSFYESVRHYPGFDNAGMTAGHEIDTAEHAEPVAAASSEPKSLVDHFYSELTAGRLPKDNVELRKMVSAFDGVPADNARLKQAQEDLEAAIAHRARDVVAQGKDDRSTFESLVSMYNDQPNLNIRTSTSIENQAYSTPAPLAYVAAKLAGIGHETKVYEPTAGNGMLLLTADPKNVTANELEDQRYANLKAQGFDAIQGDALQAIESGAVPKDSQDAVIANPPFGSVKDDAGKATKVSFDGFKLGKIDHLIAAEALRAMKDDGKATIILGADKVAGGLGTDDRIFFNWLYGNYHVTSHFEVDGKLYGRQGASWPVRVITVDGREKSKQVSPREGTIARVDNWNDVYEQYRNGLDAQNADVGDGSGRAVGTGEPAPVDDTKPAAVTTGKQAGAADQRRPEGSAAGNGNVRGSGAGAVDNQPVQPDEGLAESDHPQRRNDQAARPDQLDAGSETRPDAGEARADGSDVAPRGDRVVSNDADNQFQTKYIPRSGRKDEGVLIPVNMAGPTQDALNRLEDEVGNIDKYAARELGYDSPAQLHDALMGLQVDSVASAIHQISRGKGTIIADQTGIGKGRQAAAIIRWAARNGHIPVFVTVKPQLFTDMYGDLADIGTHDINPFIMNSDAWISGPGGNKLFANKLSQHRKNIEAIAARGTLPEGTNALFMTYSQINTENRQRTAVMSLAHKAIFVLDESHNAGGESSTGEFIKGALDAARGAVYLSATYAKRPDNMPVYFKTDIGDAISDDDSLMQAMSAGGLPLQTVVANNLVKAGQMFRRERSYDGVSIATQVDTARRAEHEKLSDHVTEALRAIVDADKAFHDGHVKNMKEELAEQGGAIHDIAGNQASASVNHTEFSSVVHNFVRQMLLGLKADAAADKAIEALKAGEKPLIAVENTMGSFLAAYADQNGIKPGMPLGAYDYRTVLSRALDRTRYVVVQHPNGEKEKQYVPLEALDAGTRGAYRDAQAVIDKLKLDIPASPIDWMRHRLEKAGYSVAEITGRNLAVDYSQKKPTLMQVPIEEQTDKVGTTRRFNDGSLDALILNVAGSTGISLHASEKFKDQRQRHMVVAQPAQDINIFMQMLGRIHRTGQVVLPKYTILSVDLPAEKRPTALLSKKMKSLNANTSSNTESATSIKAADMLNQYGDQVIGQYLEDNPELRMRLDVPALDSNGDAPIDLARQATGRLALMPVETQHSFYNEVEDQYQALIDYLNRTNQNELEPRTFNYDAKETRAEVLHQGENPETPFGEDAYYGEYSIKAQGKPMTPDEIIAEAKENLGNQKAKEHADALIARLKSAHEESVRKNREEYGLGATFDEEKYRKTLKASKIEGERADHLVEHTREIYKQLATKPEGFDAEIARIVDESSGRATAFIQEHRIGSLWRVEINGEMYNAVVTNLKSTHKSSGNPFSMSKLQVSLALNGSLRHVTLPATQFHRIEVSDLKGRIEDLFRVRPGNEREQAKIVTGNLLAAYGEMQGTKGTIINFTKSDGSTEQGILLPKKFNFAANVRGDYRLKSSADAAKFLRESDNEDISRFGIASRDGVVRVKPEGRGIVIQVPKSKAKGGKYFLDRAITAITGDFVSSSKWMEARVRGDKIEPALDAIMNKSALYALPSMADEARGIVGDPKPQIEKQGELAVHRDLQDVSGFARESALSAKPEAERTSALTTLRRLSKRLDAGEITDAEFRLGAQNLLVKLEDKREGQIDRKVSSERVRGDLYVRERLLRAVRQGDISHEAADFAQWLLDKNPAIADDLGIGVRGAKDSEGGTAGMYNGLNRVVTLLSGNANDGTAVHEILHHTERMMPDDIRQAIYKAWSRDWQDAYKKATPEQKKLFGDMLAAAFGSKQAWDRVTNGFAKGTLKYDEHYKLVNPSEYWAVKATDLMKSRFDAKGWIARAKQWLSEMVEKVKSIFGLASDAPIIRGMKSVLDGDGEFTTKTMMSEDTRRGLESAITKPAAASKDVFLHAFRDITRTPTDQADKAWKNTAEIIGKKFDTKSSSKTFNAVEKTVFSQVSLALKDPEFGRAFYAMRRMLNHTGLASRRPADLAPMIVPNSSSLKQSAKMLFGGKRQVKELRGATQALLDGTLAGDNVHDGRTFSDDELRQHYGLTEPGIVAYKQTRAAIDASLDEVAAAEAWSMASWHVPKEMRDEIINNPIAAQRLIRNSLDAKIEMLSEASGRATDRGDHQKAEILASLMMPYVETRKKVDDIYDKAETLKSAGYVPLMRFGKYTVYANKINPETGESERDENDQAVVHYFSMFATESEAKFEHERLLALYKDDPSINIERGIRSQLSHELYNGLSPETLSLFADVVGPDTAMNTIIQQALSDRSALKRRLGRRAIAGFSDDLPRVLSSFLTSNGRFAAQRFYMNDVNSAIQSIDKNKGDSRDQAIELKQFLMSGKDPGAKTMASMFLWTMAGSPSSALAIAAEPFQKIFPYLSMYGRGRAAAAITKAIPHALGKKEVTDPELRAAMHRAEQEGIIHPQEIFHLYDQGMENMGTWASSQMRKFGGTGAIADSVRVRATAATTILGMMHSAAETFGRKVAFHAAWNVAKARGEADPYAWTVRAMDEAGSQFGKINRSKLERSFAGRMFMAYRNYQIGWLGLAWRMAKKGGKEGRRGFATLFASLFVLAGLQGMPFHNNIADVVDSIGQARGHNTDMKRSERQWIEGHVGETMGDLLLHGIGRMLPIDMSEHMSLGDIIPGTKLLKANERKAVYENILNLLGPEMSFGTKIVNAFDATSSGNYTRAFAEVAPSVVKHLVLGTQMLESGQSTDATGHKIGPAGVGDALAKFAGGATTKTNKQAEIREEVSQAVGTVQDKQAQIVNMWARGLVQDDPSAVEKARENLKQWNTDNPDTKIVLTPSLLMNQVKQMRMDANTRAIIDAPKGLKGDAVRELRPSGE